jgi:hypothetical protein
VRRAKSAYGEWLAELRDWTAFATLTFAPGATEANAGAPSVSDASALRRFGYYLRRAQRVLGRQVTGVVALEHHASGQPHGHGLLAIEGPHVKGELVALGRLWEGTAGNGYSRHEVPRKRGDVARYCAKYLVKDGGDVVFSPDLGRRLL